MVVSPPEEAPNHPGMRFLPGIIDGLSADPKITLIKRDKALRPKSIEPGEFAINHHSNFHHPRNLNIKLGYFNDLLYFDRYGYSGWSEIARSEFHFDSGNLACAERYFEEVIFRRYLAQGESKYSQERYGAPLPSDYILVPLQVPRDKVLDLAFFSQQEMISRIIRQKIAPVVIKVHPMSYHHDPEHVKQITALHDPASGIFVVRDHIHDLIKGSKVVVCTNSGAGFEALLLGKPVVTCGRADYHHLTQQVQHIDALIPAIESAKSVEDQIMKTYMFWHFSHMLDAHDPPETWTARIIDKLNSHSASL